MILLGGAASDTVGVDGGLREGDDVEEFAEEGFVAALAVLPEGEQELEKNRRTYHHDHRDCEAFLAHREVFDDLGGRRELVF